MSNEFPAQSGDQHHNIQAPTTREFDDIYRDQAASVGYNQTQSERSIHPASEKAYKIAKDISEARERRLATQFFTHSENHGPLVGVLAKVIAMPSRLEPLTEDVLRTKESEVGATIFGPMAPNETRREFCYDRRIADRDSWMFHQELIDKEVTLHYEVHQTGILRLSSNPSTPNAFISGQELDNFVAATTMYRDMVISKLYDQAVYTGKKAA